MILPLKTITVIDRAHCGALQVYCYPDTDEGLIIARTLFVERAKEYGISQPQINHALKESGYISHHHHQYGDVELYLIRTEDKQD